jgi:hypothetical protein
MGKRTKIQLINQQINLASNPLELRNWGHARSIQQLYVLRNDKF